MWLALKRAFGVRSSRKSRFVPNLRRTLPGAKQGCATDLVHVLSEAEKSRMHTVMTDEPLWRSGADLSAPQQIVVGEPTGRLSGVREQTCRLPSKLSLGSRQVGCLAFGSRPVGSPAYRRWGPDRSVPQKIGVGGPTCRLPRHCHTFDLVFFFLSSCTRNLAHKSQCCKYTLTEPHAPTMHVKPGVHTRDCTCLRPD